MKPTNRTPFLWYTRSFHSAPIPKIFSSISIRTYPSSPIDSVENQTFERWSDALRDCSLRELTSQTNKPSVETEVQERSNNPKEFCDKRTKSVDKIAPAQSREQSTIPANFEQLLVDLNTRV